MKQAPTKTRIRKARQRGSAFAILPEQARTQFDAWWWSGLAILIAAALLRLVFLTLKPLHHDEGVNGVFLATLFRTGYYHYDPSNYHGPSLYYLAVIPTAINNVFHWGHGLSSFVIRLVTAAFGVGVVWLILSLRRWLGQAATLAAAAFAAVSPGFVFFSRYFIHEILFVFFTLGIVTSWLWYRATEKPRYLFLASASAALLFTTKETWIITAAVWLIAIPCTALYQRVVRIPADNPAWSYQPASEKDELDEENHQKMSKGKRRGIAAAIFVAISVLLYSSFFTNLHGILDSVLTFTYWTKTSDNGIYNREWSTYFSWLWEEEAPLLVLGGLGVLVAFIRARSRFLVFCAFWTLGIFSAYSLVPYKTPWLALSIILPLVLMAGYAIGEAYQPGLRVLSVVVAGAAICISLYQAIEISFVHYDDDTYAYVYGHTNRDFLGLIQDIETVAAANPAKNEIGITVMSPEHWPLPWYLRDYPRVGYWGRVVETTQPIVLALDSQVPDAEKKMGNNYRLYSTHVLRPGNTLVMFVRKDIPQ